MVSDGGGRVPEAQPGRSGQPPRGSSSPPTSTDLQLYTLLTSLTHRSTRDQRLQYQPTPYQVSHPGDPSEMQLFLTTVQRFDRTTQYQPSFDLAL